MKQQKWMLTTVKLSPLLFICLFASYFVFAALAGSIIFIMNKIAIKSYPVDFLQPAYIPSSLNGATRSFSTGNNQLLLRYKCAKPPRLPGITITKANAATLLDQSTEQYERIFRESHAGQRYMEYIYDRLMIGNIPALHITVHDQMTHDFSGRLIFYTEGTRYELIANPKCIISPIKDELSKMATSMVSR